LKLRIVVLGRNTTECIEFIESEARKELEWIDHIISTNRSMMDDSLFEKLPEKQEYWNDYEDTKDDVEEEDFKSG
jgi:hypothetical protein